MRRWSESTGAGDAGIIMLADGDAAFSKSLGMTFNAPATAMFNRSRRYSMLVEDGIVTIFNPESPNGGCEISGGEHMLDQL